MNINKLILESLNNLNSNFYKWFGDSKVVNEDGSPLIVFHGSSSEDDFEIFNGERGIGWFTPNKDYANNYVRDGKLMQLYLCIKNPFILNISPQSEMTLDEFIELTNIQTSKKYSGKKYENEIRPVYDWYNPSYTDFLSQLDKKGFDGLKTIEYEKYESFLPLYHNQIKSIDNDGSWDINDDNIFS